MKELKIRAYCQKCGELKIVKAKISHPKKDKLVLEILKSGCSACLIENDKHRLTLEMQQSGI